MKITFNGNKIKYGITPFSCLILIEHSVYSVSRLPLGMRLRFRDSAFNHPVFF